MLRRIVRAVRPFDGDAFGLFCLFKDRPQAFFLDSSRHGIKARFSYIGFDPFMTVKGRSLAVLKKEFDQYRVESRHGDLTVGAVGYLGYDGSLLFGFYDTVLAIDHLEGKLIISSFSKGRIEDLLRMMRSPRPVFPRSFNKMYGPLNFKTNFTKKEYLKAVRRALDHIRRGDIYQINLSHRVALSFSGWQKHTHPAGIYGHLRRLFPSSFGCYFNDGRRFILSASPERFLKLQGSTVQVKPMKGTRPRGTSGLKDRQLKDELLKSEKEKAELLMVTDLERNDLGRVCDYGSVKVKTMRTIESYSSVFQATSTIEGRLRKDKDAFDLLQAAFPSGSVTGCPKIEAMRIINQLERGSRGLYTGALGYISFNGNMDFNVMIRTLFLDKNSISFHVGGGIVADSNPQAEWEETWDKAQPLMEALRLSFQ